MSVPKCTSIFGHKFEARCDRRYGMSLDLPQDQPMTSDIIEACRNTRTYIHDICVRCGHVVQPSREATP